MSDEFIYLFFSSQYLLNLHQCRRKMAGKLQKQTLLLGWETAGPYVTLTLSAFPLKCSQYWTNATNLISLNNLAQKSTKFTC